MNGEAGPAQYTSVRALGYSVYLPAFIFAVGQGAVVPIVPLAARNLGATVAFASFVVALRSVGTLLFDLPAGMLLSRFGERVTLGIGAANGVAAIALCALTPSPVVFGAGMVLLGTSWGVWLLARLAFVSEVMPSHLRGRALSTLGGVNRIGNLVGPFLGSALVRWRGLDTVFWLHASTALVALLSLSWGTRGSSRHRAAQVAAEQAAYGGPGGHGGPGGTGTGHAHVAVRETFRAHRHTFLTAGIGAMTIGALRATRNAAIPLWAEHIGVDAAGVGLIFGIASALDTVMFYPAGSLMDRRGRRWVALPCLFILAIGHMLLPLAQSFAGLVAVALVIGFGNGMGSGIVMTLGADFSPSAGRAEFLGAWRVMGDTGVTGGPLILSALGAAASLGVASVAIGALALASGVVMALRMPETLRREAPG